MVMLSLPGKYSFITTCCAKTDRLYRTTTVSEKTKQKNPSFCFCNHSFVRRVVFPAYQIQMCSTTNQYFDFCLANISKMAVYLCISSVAHFMFYMPLHVYLTGSHTVPAEDQLSGSC